MPGNALGITLPTVGLTVGPTYATQINSALTTLIADIEAKITPDEIDINADLSFTSGGSYYSATDLDTIEFRAQTAELASSYPLRLYSYNGELYYQDLSGNNVQMTASGSVNNAAAGSINTTGSPAYGASGVELLWSGTDTQYRFKDGSGADDLGDLVCNDILLGNGSNRTTLDTDVTSDYTVTFPAAAPTDNNSVVQIDTNGDLSFTEDPVVDTLTSSGAVQGSKLYHSSTETKVFSPNAYRIISGATAPTDTNYFVAGTSGSNGVLRLPLGGYLLQGCRITEIRLDYQAGVASGTWGLFLQHTTSGANSVTTHEQDTWTPGGTGFLQQTWTLSSPYTVTNALWVELRILISAAVSSGKRVYGVRVTFDRAAP